MSMYTPLTAAEKIKRSDRDAALLGIPTTSNSMRFFTEVSSSAYAPLDNVDGLRISRDLSIDTTTDAGLAQLAYKCMQNPACVAIDTGGNMWRGFFADGPATVDGYAKYAKGVAAKDAFMKQTCRKSSCRYWIRSQTGQNGVSAKAQPLPRGLVLFEQINFGGPKLFIAKGGAKPVTYVKSWSKGDWPWSPYEADYTVQYRSAYVPDGMELKFVWADGSQNTDWAVLGPGNYPDLWAGKDLRHTASSAWVRGDYHPDWPMSAVNNITSSFGYKII